MIGVVFGNLPSCCLMTYGSGDWVLRVMVLGTVRKHLLGALMEMKNHCENTFVNCGHLKKNLLLPDLKIWKNNSY